MGFLPPEKGYAGGLQKKTFTDRIGIFTFTNSLPLQTLYLYKLFLKEKGVSLKKPFLKEKGVSLKKPFLKEKGVSLKKTFLKEKGCKKVSDKRL